MYTVLQQSIAKIKHYKKVKKRKLQTQRGYNSEWMKLIRRRGFRTQLHNFNYHISSRVYLQQTCTWARLDDKTSLDELFNIIYYSLVNTIVSITVTVIMKSISLYNEITIYTKFILNYKTISRLPLTYVLICIYVHLWK